MKKITWVVMALSITLISAAQKNDAAAKAILDAVSNKFKTYSSVQAAFNYKVENAAGKVLSTKAGTLLMKGTRYKVNFIGQEIISNGKTVWNYDKAAKEVTINDLDANGATLTPQKMFTNFYDKDFLYVLMGEKKAGAKILQLIQLTPRDKSKPFFRVDLEVDKASQTITTTKVYEKAGSRYTYSISTFNPNASISDNTFVYDKKKYPGVEEVDLR